MVFEVIGLVKVHASYWMWCSSFCCCLFVLLVKNSSFDTEHQFYVCQAVSYISRLCFWSLICAWSAVSYCFTVWICFHFTLPVLLGMPWFSWPLQSQFSFVDIFVFVASPAYFGLFKTLGVRAILLASFFSFLMWALSTGSFPSSPAVWHPSCFHRLYFHSHMLSVLYNSSGDLFLAHEILKVCCLISEYGKIRSLPLLFSLIPLWAENTVVWLQLSLP